MSKILFIHHYNNYSGSTRVLCNVIREEYGDSVNNRIITDMSSKGFLSDLNTPKSNVPILRVKGRAIPFVSQFIWSLIGFVKIIWLGRKYDVFYINTIVPAYAAVAGRIMGKKIIYHIHETLDFKRVQNKIAKYIFCHTKGEIIYVSEYVASYYDSLNKPYKIVYNKLSKEFVSNIVIKPLNEHHLNTVIIISSLLESKGLYMFRDLAKKMQDLKFVLIAGANEKQIDVFFKSDIPVNMFAYPTQKNIHPFLRDADLLLNLSIPSLVVETFGMTIIEGMSYGLPAIVPNVGGPIEIVSNGYNGYCVDVTNIDEMVYYIRKCLTSQKYCKLRENALAKSRLFMY